MKFMKYFFLLVAIFISACEQKAGDRTSEEFSLPLLRECESELLTSLDQQVADNVLDSYNVIRFDLVLDSHPDVIGVVKVFGSTRKESKWSISAKVNSATINCYPISKIAIPKSKKLNYDLDRIVKENDRLGIKSYIVVGENDYLIYVKQ